MVNKKLMAALMSQTLGGCNFQWSTIPIYINVKKGLCDRPMQKRHVISCTLKLIRSFLLLTTSIIKVFFIENL